MPETTTTDTATIDVPRRLLDTIVDTCSRWNFLDGKPNTRVLADAYIDTLDSPDVSGTEPDTRRVNARNAWILGALGCSSSVYDLDLEEVDHPAFAAELELMGLVEKNAPELAEQLAGRYLYRV